MAKRRTGTSLAPPELRPSEQSVKELRIQAIENLTKVTISALRAREELAAPDLLHQMGLPPDLLAIQVNTIPVRISTGDWLSKQLT